MGKQERNAKCSCGGGGKYKKCCMRLDEKAERISMFDRFAVMEDPRDKRGKRYGLIELLVMVVYGILNGYEDFENMADFLGQREWYFRSLLMIDKTPSHDCLSDLFAAIDPAEFMEIFVEWIREIVKVRTGATIAIDGKAIRSARDRINGGNTPYVLSAYLSEIGISIGQVAVDQKSNEFKSIPELLGVIDIKGCYVTIDAIGTHETIARKIASKKGHYALKVKGNQKTLMNDIEAYFAGNIANNGEIQMGTTPIESKHGRDECREYYISHDVSCITDREKWDTVKSVGLVRVYRAGDDAIEIKDNCYIMDTKISMEQFKKVTRSHWGIECGLHWRLDVIMGEDRSRNRAGHSVSNLSVVRKIVFNMVRLDKSFGEISFKKKLTRYRLDSMAAENLIFSVFPAVHS